MEQGNEKEALNKTEKKIGQEKTTDKKVETGAAEAESKTAKKASKKESSKAKTKKDEKAEEKRLQARRVQRVKREAFEFEEDNNSKIMAFYSGPGWHKMGGNSALIYTHMLAPQLDISPIMRDDRDFYARFEHGILSVRDVNVLKKDLLGLGLKLEKETEDMIIFALDKALSDAELRSIRTICDEQRAQANRIAAIGKMYPAITAKSREVAKKLHRKLIHSPAVNKDYIILKLAQDALERTIDLTQIAKGRIDAEEGLTRVRDCYDRMKVSLVLLMEMGVFSSEETLDLEVDMDDVATQVEAELEKMQK